MLVDSYAAADLNDIGVHILRSGTRAQPADAAARPGVDPAAPRDHARRRSSRRSWSSA